MNRIILILIAALFLYPGGLQAQEEHWEFSGWYGGGCYPNMAFDPAKPQTVYLVSDVAGVWKSEDLGEHWVAKTNGLGNLIVAFIAPAPSNSQRLYAGTRAGMYQSMNGGEMWQSCGVPSPSFSFNRPQSYRSVAVSESNELELFAGTSNGDLWHSTDGCETWTALGSQPSIFPEKTAISAVILSKDKFLFAGSKKGLMRFSFSNQEWNKMSAAPLGITDLEPWRSDGWILLAAGNDRLFYSEDDGESWQSSSPILKGLIERVSAFKNSRGVMSLAAAWSEGWNGGVLLSRDFGTSWISADRNLAKDVKSNPTRSWQRNGGKTTSVHVSPRDPRVMFRTDWWGVWKSTDGGANWDEKIVGTANSVGSDLALDDFGGVYVATMDDGLLKSSDGGKSYEALFPAKKYSPQTAGHVWRVIVSPDGQKIVATSSPWNEAVNQVIVSRDGGKSFRLIRKNLPRVRPRKNTMWGEGYPRALAQDPRDANRLYLGIDGDDGGGLFTSPDGGFTWSRAPGQPESLRIYNGLIVDPLDSKILYWAACGEKGGIYVSRDAGQSWQLEFHESRWVFDLHAAKDGSIYAAADLSGAVLFVSRDQGKSWKKLGSFSAKGSAEAIISSPKNYQLIAFSTMDWSASAPQKIFLSENGGQDWKDITGDLPPGAGAAAMRFSSDGKFLYLSRTVGSVYRRVIS